MKNLFIGLFLAFAAMSHAQHKLLGTISDTAQLPVAGVSVYLPDLHKGTVTDANGRYEFNNLPEGTVSIVVSSVGFITRNKNVSISGETTFDITLEENVHQMDEVIVSTAFNRLQSQNVMKVEHVGIKSMHNKGVSTLAEGLATIPGVKQLSTGTSIGKPVIRGLTGNRVLVYSQGVRMENQQFGEEHGLGLSDSGIESAEVIKGPASLLYGSDALGGVLYLNPEKFADANAVKADFSERLFSNTLGSITSIGAKGSTENWKFLTRGSFATHSDYKIPDGRRVTNSRYNETDFKSGIGYGNTGFSGVFRYNFNRLDLGLPEAIGLQSASKNPLYPKQGVDNHILSLHSNIFMGNSTLDGDIGYILNDRREFEDSETPVLHMKLRTINYDLKYHFPKSEKMAIIAGVQGMHQENTNYGEELLIPDALVTDFGIFGTMSYDWRKNALQAGLRYDYRTITSEAHGAAGDEGSFDAVDKNFSSINASVGLKTVPVENLSLRINLASGFRAPNLAELTSNGVHEGSNRYEIGNANLETEQNFQADVNAEYKSSHFEFFANGFYNHISNYIYLLPTGEVINDAPAYIYVQDNAMLFGGEAGIHFHPHPLDMLHFESAFETVTGKRSDGSHLPLIPANSWSNTLRGEFNLGNWFADGYARLNAVTTFRQRNISAFETPSAGYTIFNLGIGGKVNFYGSKFEASLNANNLFNKEYIPHLSRLKPAGIPDIGRNVVLSINFNL
ncbi:MAG TPA: TonB-dependent receptor [Flavobacterium sp.]|jgi:iron complex outermembrane receptor protein